jgi:hypothetical protein
MGDVCHSTFGSVPFIRKCSDVIVLLIPSISHYNCFLCLLQESIPNVQIVDTEDPVAAK